MLAVMKIWILYLAIVSLLFLLNGCEGQRKNGCFTANYLVSCLSIMCEFGGSCPGDPDAVCRIERPDKCAGCEQVWYRKDGTKAECGSRQNLKLCPGGEPVVHCKVDSCKWPCMHPAFKDKPCRQSFCGRCQAEYLIGDRWLKCPKATTGFSGETLPIDAAVRERATKACMHIPCPLDACVGQFCLKYPEASCRPDGCNKCQPVWYLGNKPVDCLTGDIFPPVSIEPIDPLTGDRRVCANGEGLMTCSDDICLGETCPNYPNAVCRPDGCGQCKATWYVDNIHVDCFSTECPANVIRYKCVVDPCIYFSHYCPAAECRATECGRCEAKFYVGNKEISCVQPPKKCLPGEHTMVCPWYTCPSTVCPSNLNLMCRINPCGFSCQREWVDVRTGKIETCRTLDKVESTNKTVEKVFMEDPLARFHDSGLEPAEKPYIEVKKKPIVKPSKIDTFTAAAAAAEVPIITKEKLPIEGPISSGAVAIPMSNSLPMDFHRSSAAIPIPMKESHAVEAQKTPMMIPAKIHAPPGDLSKGNVVMLGGNDPQLQSLLLDILGLNKMESLSASPDIHAAESTDPFLQSAGTLPVPIKSGKPILLTRNSQFEFKPTPLLFNELTINHDQMKTTGKEPIPQGSMTVHKQVGMPQLDSFPPIQQNPVIDSIKVMKKNIEVVPLQKQSSVIERADSMKQAIETVSSVHEQPMIMTNLDSVPSVQDRPVIMTKLDTIPTVQHDPVIDGANSIITNIDHNPPAQDMALFGTVPFNNQASNIKKSPVTLVMVNKKPASVTNKVVIPVVQSQQPSIPQAEQPNSFALLYPELEFVKPPIGRKFRND